MSWLKKRRAENEILEAAKRLKPSDHSPEAEQLRETAEDIRDHRSSERNAHGGEPFWEEPR